MVTAGSDRELVNSAKFRSDDKLVNSPSAISFMQAGAGLVVIAGIVYAASRYFGKGSGPAGAGYRKTG